MSKNPGVFIILILVVAVGVYFFMTQSQKQETVIEENVSTSESTSQDTVTIANFAFSPATITVKTGSTVIWTNEASVAHTVTSDSGNELDSPLLSQGKSYSHTFSQAGTFSYHCTPHPNMKGTVIVE